MESEICIGFVNGFLSELIEKKIHELVSEKTVIIVFYNRLHI